MRSKAAQRRTKRRTKLWVMEKTNTLRDDYGTPTSGFTHVKNPDGSRVWLMGYVDDRAGREIEIARRSVPTVNSRISIPFYPSLSTQYHRLVSVRTGEAYEIAFINNVDDIDREMIILATSIPRSGENTTPYNPTVNPIVY